jgi:hypothetical protein
LSNSIPFGTVLIIGRYKKIIPMVYLPGGDYAIDCNREYQA